MSNFISTWDITVKKKILRDYIPVRVCVCVCMCAKAGVDSDYVRCQIVTRKQREINQGK